MKDIDQIRRENMKLLEAHGGATTGPVGPTGAANLVGWEQPQWSNYRNGAKEAKTGKQRGMRKETAWRIEDAFGMPRGWLDVDHTSNVTLANVGTRRIPLISYVQAGNWTEASVAGNFDDWLLTDLDLSPRAFALTIKGDSMMPDFREGDAVLIDPAVMPQPGDFVAAKNGDHKATFKKYRPRGLNENGEQIFELVPLNPDHEPMRSDREPIEIIGTMMEHRRYRKR
jgi:SOS-response transcriptional repressor LexA